MSFFDDLGKVVTDVSQSAVQKGREMADIAKCKSQIAEEEKKLDQLYAQVGKRYMALHGENVEADFSGYASAIKTSEKRLQEYRDNLGILKNMTRCPKCGAQVPRESQFCLQCGARIVEEDDEVLKGEPVD